MEVCHSGHDTYFLGYLRSYCDCGADKCNLSKKSKILAKNVLHQNVLHENDLLVNVLQKNVIQGNVLQKNILEERSSDNVGVDAEGRINGTIESGLIIKPFEVSTIRICSTCLVKLKFILSYFIFVLSYHVIISPTINFF